MDIKGCPFCGGDKLIIQKSTEDREGVPIHVMCSDCGAGGPWEYDQRKESHDNLDYVVLVTGWNNRGEC